MTAPSVVPSPTFVDVVNQNYFIESQRGAQQITTYLDAFPDSVYNKALDSVLVTFLYALLGPAGVGQLSQEYLEARLEYEDATLAGASLDQLYTSPFAFARLAEETYDIDAQASLLTSAQRAQILAQDASFRNRAIDFLKGIRAGGTLLGFQLVAKSGLNHPVDVIENWRALYDQYMDAPLGLPFQGTTSLLNEVIILPRQSNPQSSVQTLSISGNPYSGYFTLSFPAGPDYQFIRITGQGTNTVTVPAGSVKSVGQWITAGGYFAQVSAINSPTSVTLVYGPGTADAGQPIPGTAFTNGTTINGWVSNARTYVLPYNATAQQVQAALWNLPVIGNGNCIVRGGPFPSADMTVEFTGALADQDLPTLLFNTTPDTVSGIVAAGTSPGTTEVVQMADVSNNPLTISTNVTVETAGVSSTSQQVAISPADQHAMEVAIDTIRPMTVFVTTQPAPPTKIPQPVSTASADTTMTEVLLYATGESSVKWPAPDGVHWIEAGIEHEAPRALNTGQQHYQAFHNIANIISYTEGALTDTDYVAPAPGSTPIWQKYWNNHIGLYSHEQITLHPVLKQHQDPNARHTPKMAQAPSPDPLVITNRVNNISIINYEYPTDYLSLPGIPQLPTSGQFWSSAERSSGTDYLEIDLGAVQPVNYIYFEATTKPYTVHVAYDTLDMSPNRQFIDASFSSTTASDTSIAYSGVTKPWQTIKIHTTNAMGHQIFTRYLRIGFTRNPGKTIYVTAKGQVYPYSLEVRNLRVGRVVS